MDGIVDFKDKIIDDLTVILEKEKQSGNSFKIRAYQKVIPQLKNKTSIFTLDDIKDIDGIGKGIKDRIKEIIETGELKSAEEIKNDPKLKVIEEFMKIYGVGPVKAKDLYEKNGFTSIEELKISGDKYLNEKQKIGLKYYEDINERIPRKEMIKHQKYISKIVNKINSNIVSTLVGSFRRNKPDSGDIDVLISYNNNDMSYKDAEEDFKKIIDKMIEDKYIIEVLAIGKKKCMGICVLDKCKFRRLDLLLTKAEEYPYALLYFTGSDKFNIEMRKKALELGYSLNEHGLTSSLKKKIQIPDIKTEEDVFNFLQMKYIEPNKR